MNNMMKQLQALQSNMAKMQEGMSSKEFSASAGGDMVTVTVTGKKEIKKVSISKDIVDPNDIGLLEDVVASAVNAALKKAEEEVGADLQKLTQDIKLPPGMSL